jgi:hypothetical protein
MRGRDVFTTPAYRNGDELAAKLGLTGRAWELWSVMESIFELLDVPEEDREAARVFYRASIPTVKAELGSIEHALLTVLLDEVPDGVASFGIRSDLLTQHVNKTSGNGEPVDEARVGRMLRDLALLEGARRIWVKDKRPSLWTINSERVRKQALRWKIETEGEAS